MWSREHPSSLPASTPSSSDLDAGQSHLNDIHYPVRTSLSDSCPPAWSSAVPGVCRWDLVGPSWTQLDLAADLAIDISHSAELVELHVCFWERPKAREKAIRQTCPIHPHTSLPQLIQFNHVYSANPDLGPKPARSTSHFPLTSRPRFRAPKSCDSRSIPVFRPTSARRWLHPRSHSHSSQFRADWPGPGLTLALTPMDSHTDTLTRM